MSFLTSIQYDVTITPSAVDDTQVLTNGLAATRLQITTTTDGTTPAYVFVYQVEVEDPMETEPENQVKALFTNVASPNDMQELPVGAQFNTAGHMFRHDEVDVLLPTYDLIETLKDQILADLDALVERNKLLTNPASESQQTESGTIN